MGLNTSSNSHNNNTCKGDPHLLAEAGFRRLLAQSQGLRAKDIEYVCTRVCVCLRARVFVSKSGFGFGHVWVWERDREREGDREREREREGERER